MLASTTLDRFLLREPNADGERLNEDYRVVWIETGHGASMTTNNGNDRKRAYDISNGQVRFCPKKNKTSCEFSQYHRQDSYASAGLIDDQKNCFIILFVVFSWVDKCLFIQT